MNIILIIGVILSALLVLGALARGLFHFAQGHNAAVNGSLQANQQMQNRMMMSRVKWQAITILLLVLIGIMSTAN